LGYLSSRWCSIPGGNCEYEPQGGNEEAPWSGLGHFECFVGNRARRLCDRCNDQGHESLEESTFNIRCANASAWD
jgi:hypothetical protein